MKKSKQDTLIKVGFLSEGNYDSVKHELSSCVEPVYFDTKDNLYSAVKSGHVLAGLTSGTHEDTELNVFGPEQISLHAILMNKDNDILIDLIDRVLVNIIESGGVEEIALSNHPYRALVAHSCTPEPVHFEWPELKNNSVYYVVRSVLIIGVRMMGIIL